MHGSRHNAASPAGPRKRSDKTMYAILVPMRVGLNAHLLSDGEGYRSAGIHGYINNLLRQLPSHAPASWQFEAMVGASNSTAFPGVSTARAPFNTESPWSRIFWEQVAQPMQLHRFDLYHALAFVGPLFLTAPMVVTVYDLSFLRYPERLSLPRRLYLRSMTALTCERARRVLAISQNTADDLTALLGVPGDKIDVTPLGYDRAAFRPLQPAAIDHFRRKQKLPERFWLYVGTLEPRKNLLMLLRAYSQVAPAERLPLILGGGIGWRGRTVLAAIERLGLRDSVKHVGFIPTADLPFWYNCAEAFLYPSVFEGFGLPVLEAMACGVPVVTSNASSLPEVVGTAGKCLPPDEHEHWASALKELKANAEWLISARASGLERASLFSWARTAEMTLASYRKALAEREVPLSEGEQVTRVEP